MLQSMNLGKWALFGRGDMTCSVRWKSMLLINVFLANIDLPNLASLSSKGNSFANAYTVVLEGINYVVVSRRYSEHY